MNITYHRASSLTLFHIIILAFIQGLTEFLPVSSSGHLILVPIFLKWPDQGLAVDVALHLGTLGAVVVYFWRDICNMTTGLLSTMGGRPNVHGKLAIHLIIATIPAVVVGSLVSYFGLNDDRTLKFIGWTTLTFGLLLYIADQRGLEYKSLRDLKNGQALLLGCAQAIALLPGVSRSGICITMARFLDYSRNDAARFAFLMSIPVIIAAGSHTALKLFIARQAFFTQEALIGAGIAFIVGLAAIKFMLTWLQRSDFKIFVIYRVFLGMALLIYAYC